MARSKTVQHLFLSLLLSALVAQNAFGEEYNLPDPPGALVFDTVAYRVIPVPNGQVPENCDSKYRAGMESSFRTVWQQCQDIGRLAPSDCQRALFARCTELGADLQKMET